MCTAATYKTKDFYMGRTLDYEFSYGEQITITPRNYEFDFRFAGKIKSHYALIGMAFVAEGYPLYYDAVNEKGLGMAGLNFVGNAAYEEALPEDETEVSQVAQFEFIPWILTQCATVAEAREKLAAMRLTGTAFSEQLPTAQLHWIIADKDSCIVVESMKDGLHVYDNPVGVLTNNPPFPSQMFALNNYAGVSRKQPESTFAGKYKEIFNSDAVEFGGEGVVNSRVKTAKAEECDEREYSIKVKLPALGVSIYSCTPGKAPARKKVTAAKTAKDKTAGKLVKTVKAKAPAKKSVKEEKATKVEEAVKAEKKAETVKKRATAKK